MDVGEYIHPDFRTILDGKVGPVRDRNLYSPGYAQKPPQE